MKKILLALGLSLSFGLTQAQSSVTVYGILDVGFIGTNYKGVGTSATTKQTTATFGNGAESSSLLGFRGVEDLGGGSSAFFTVETGLTPELTTASTFNNRQSFLGLKQNGVGQFAFGTQYTPIHAAVKLTDPTNAGNAIGSVIYATTPQSNSNPGQNTFANTTSSAGTTDAYTTRVANALTVTTDTFNGVTGTALVVLNNSNTTQTSATAGGTNNSNGWGLGVNYAWQKLFLTANYQAFKNYTTGTLASPTPVIWNAASGAVNTQDNQAYVAATYDFGSFKTYAQYVNRRVTDSLDSSYYAQRSAEQLAIKGFVTSNIESWASVGMGRVTAWGVSQPTANFTAYQVGSNYWFSKRTNLYAIFGSNQTSSVAPSTLGVSGNEYALGIRHVF
jgi:predicted porin